MADIEEQTEEALGWAAEGKKLAVDIPEVSFKDAATFVAEMTPIVGDVMAAKEVYDELQKDEPNYYLAGALGGAALVGLVPGLGDAAAKAIKKGAKEVFDVAKRVEVDPNTLGSLGGNIKIAPKATSKSKPSYTDAELLEADDIIDEWGKGNLTNIELRNQMRDIGFPIETKRISPKKAGDDLEVVSPDGNIIPWKDMPRGVDFDPDSMGSGLGNVQLKPKQPFKKTRKAYRIATQAEDGKLYPLFVNASDEIPVGEWVSASVPPVTFKGANGNMYVPSKGAARSKGEKAKATGDMQTLPDQETADQLKAAGFSVEKPSKAAPFGKVRAVASRPGFHATTKPVAHHLGPEDLIISSTERDKLLKAGVTPKAFKAKTFNYLDGKLVSKKKVAALSAEDKKKVKSQKKYYVKRRAEDQVFVEVEMADDTSEDLLQYMQERGRTDINDKLPSGGSYTYQDGQADAETWVVGGDMKVNRVLSREEAKAAQEAAGVKDLPYRDEIEEILGRKFAKGGLIGEEDMYTGQQDALLSTGMGSVPNFNEGGAVMNNSKNQMEMLFDEGGIADDGMNVDPVSGNEIPPGSMASEVRDDIPAQLSEGEYVVPADVLRFYGVKFFEDLRSEAKQGMAQMEADGRIGGEPVGMEDPRDAESALTPEEMAVLQEMGMAVGGMVPQPTQSTDPYMQQQNMYQQPSPVAMGNTGYNEGGLEDGITPIPDSSVPDNTQSTFDPSMYGAGFSFLSPSTPAETAPATSTVMLYSPDGLTTQSFTLPAQQTEYDSKLAAGWSTTQVQTPQVTTQAVYDDDPPIKPDTGEQGKKFSEMSGEELQNALNQNKKASAIMKGLVVVNPMLGLAGLGATRYAEKQILENMKKKGVEPVESDDPTMVEGIANWIGDKFGTQDKEPDVTPKSSAVSPTATSEPSDDGKPTDFGGTAEAAEITAAAKASKTSENLQKVKEKSDSAYKAATSTEKELESTYGSGLNKGGLMQKKKKK